MPILAILSMLAGAGMSLMTLVFLMAGGANSSAPQIRQIKMMMLGVALFALVGLVGGIWAFIKQRYGLSALVGAVPLVGCIALIAWMFITEY